MEFFRNIQTKLSVFWHSWLVNNVADATSTLRSGLFRSARAKLTSFYLIVLIVFSLILTISLRSLAGDAFDRAGAGDRGMIKQLVNNYYSVPIKPNFFDQFQSNQSANIHRDLDEDVVIINAIAIIVGGVVSYWYAGRTLRPIEEAHETQARFAADASHELRTPLAALKVENEVFLHQKSAKLNEARDLIKSNLEEVQRLENLASNLLALTQYEQASFTLQPTNLHVAIVDALAHATSAAKAKKVAFVNTVPVGATVMGQSDSLTQLIGIIVDNAIKYGSSHSTVYIDAVKRDNRYHLSIRDEGNGISEEDLPYIFDRLYRGDKSRTSRTPGYGLGLSLAHEIARANQATMTARNYPSGGAQFVVSFVTFKNK